MGRVLDELRTQGSNIRTVIARALVAYGGQNPQPTSSMTLEADSVLHEVLRMNHNLQEQLQTLSETVIELFGELRHTGMGIGARVVEDDDEVGDTDYALAIANAVKRRNEE
jgi:4-aminobutyrate aminotransferase-like enzyme